MVLLITGLATDHAHCRKGAGYKQQHISRYLSCRLARSACFLLLFLQQLQPPRSLARARTALRYHGLDESGVVLKGPPSLGIWSWDSPGSFLLRSGLHTSQSWVLRGLPQGYSGVSAGASARDRGKAGYLHSIYVSKAPTGGPLCNSSSTGC